MQVSIPVGVPTSLNPNIGVFIAVTCRFPTVASLRKIPS